MQILKEALSMNLRFLLSSAFFLLALGMLSVSAYSQERAVLKAGMIGLDTSHCGAFTKLLRDAPAGSELASVQVVAAYPGGSPDVASSRDRVAGYTEEMRGLGVEIVDSIPALLEKVDVVFLESVDGRPHLEQVRQVFDAKKPVFIDKPLAGSLADAVEIYRLAEESQTPCFSSSSLRFSPGTLRARASNEIGEVLGCEAYSPCTYEEHHPDLFWYGIHGVETLFTVMGPGCKTVRRVQSPGMDLVVGEWDGGRIGSFRGLRDGKTGYGATVFGTKQITDVGEYGGYEPLVAEIVKFFHTGTPPVGAKETLEIYAFMEAADESKRQGGAAVSVEETLEKARQRAGELRAGR
jgi:predicted dehydrogenase